MKMKGKSPMMKSLVGNQKNLNEGLKAAIKAAPGKMMAKTPSIMERMQTAMKVRGMGEDAVGKVRGMGEKNAPNKIMKEKAAAKVMKEEKAAAKIMKEKAVAKIAKPDFPDIDGDGDRKESISKASADKKAAESPAKLIDPVTGDRVKGYAKNVNQVQKVRDRKERKDTKKDLKVVAKSDDKITRMERKGIRKSMRDLKTKQRDERVAKVQKQRTKDVIGKENMRLRKKRCCCSRIQRR